MSFNQWLLEIVHHVTHFNNLTFLLLEQNPRVVYSTPCNGPIQLRTLHFITLLTE